MLVFSCYRKSSFFENISVWVGLYDLEELTGRVTGLGLLYVANAIRKSVLFTKTVGEFTVIFLRVKLQKRRDNLYFWRSKGKTEREFRKQTERFRCQDVRINNFPLLKLQ